MSLARHPCTVLASTVLVVTALCVAAGPVCAQDWKAHRVPLFVSASHPSGHEGFLRVINRSRESGEVVIDAVDDQGVLYGPVTLLIGAERTVHFNSGDLEDGNAEKGLSEGIGAGTGDWRLRLRSPLDLEVLAYNRTSDGLLASLHDLVPPAIVRAPGGVGESMGHRVVIFNPASNIGQVSRLRIINRGDVAAVVTIEGIDGDGASPGTAVELEVPAGASRMVTSQELESGQGEGFSGMLGDGKGKWQLVVISDEPVGVMSLLTSPTGHLTNLSTEPGRGEGAAAEHRVPLFAAAANPERYEGFVRIINHSDEPGEVLVEAFDDAGVEYGPVTLDIDANGTVHFNSGDLEEGNAEKGLAEGIGAGTGDWRLRLRSSLDVEVLAYNRTHDGLLTSLHDLVPYTAVALPGSGDEVESHYVAIFNPASNLNQVSRLRIVNPGGEVAAVRIEGFDGDGVSPGTAVELSVPAGESRTLTSEALELGEWDAGVGASGAFGDGNGKWRLFVTADAPLEVMSLLASPTGHLVNLSTAAPAGEMVPAPVIAPNAAIEITGRTTASVGTPVALRVASVGASDVPIERFDWSFSDGQTRSGEAVSVSFAAAGVHEVTVRAVSGIDVVARTTGAVAVFDEAVGANPGFAGIPRVFGDVDQDGGFGPEDLALAEQSVAGERALGVEAIEAGDLNLSGALDERDVALLSQALEIGAELPSALLEDFAYPGAAVAVVSPALLDPDADVEVYVNEVPSPRVMRAILGYATFVIPASLTGEDTEVEVVVEADGVVAERLPLLLKPAVAPTDVTPGEDVLAFFDELSRLFASQDEAGASFLEQSGGLSADDTAIVLGVTRAAATELEAAIAELEALLNSDGGEELAAALQAALYANGLAEFHAQAGTDRSASDALPPVSPLTRSAATRGASGSSEFDVCGQYVPAVCALKKANVLFTWGATILTGVCATGALASFATINFAALAVITKLCPPVIFALTTTQLLGALVNTIELDMRLTSDKTVLQGKMDKATITAEVTFSGLRNLCTSTSSVGVETLLVKGIVKILTKKSGDVALMRKLTSDLSKPLLNSVEIIVGRALTLVGLNKAFRYALDMLCGLLGSGPVATFAADGRQFSLKASPGGLLLPKDDGTGAYSLSCSAGFSGTIVVEGNKNLCGKNKEHKITVSCRNDCDGAPEDEVNIPDAGLHAAIAEPLGKDAGEAITRADIESLEWLDASERNIRNLRGLECATGLTVVILSVNKISDVSLLSGLTSLYHLELHDNQISDISALSSLTALDSLYLSNNQISDISSLSGLTSLYRLALHDNQISDISSLSGLTSLDTLHLSNNQISDISLSGLTSLEWLGVENNQISDISLSGLTSLERLFLGNNQISDISLSGLTALKYLFLLDNQISDISALSGLTALDRLYLQGNRISNIGPLLSTGLGRDDFLNVTSNPLSRTSCFTHIPALERRGVGVGDDCYRLY